MKSAPAITFDYRPSRRLAIAATGVAALALVAVAMSGLPLVLRVVLAVVVVTCACIELRRFLQPPYVRIARDATGWRLVEPGGEVFAATLAGHVRRGPLLVLDFRVIGRRRFHGVLTPDVLDADVLRRLLLILARGADAPPMQ